jgi:hypothetical protein
MRWMTRWAPALLLVLLPMQADARPATVTGFAARYAPGMMARVARNRHMAQATCMVASQFVGIGGWLTVTGLKTGAVRRCKVVDVPQPYDAKPLLRRGIVVELDHTSAKAICGSVREPPRQCPVRVRH